MLPFLSIILAIAASFAIGIISYNINYFLVSVVVFGFLLSIIIPIYLHATKENPHLFTLPRIEIRRPEYLAAGLWLALSFLVVTIANRTGSLDDWHGNCLRGNPCSNPLTAFAWYLFVNAFAVLGGAGAIGYLAEKGKFYPPDKNNLIPHLTCYVTIGLSIVTLITYWPNLFPILLLFVGVPFFTYWTYTHSTDFDEGPERLAYERCVALAQAMTFTSPQTFTEEFAATYERRRGVALSQALKEAIQKIAATELPASAPDIPAPQRQFSIPPLPRQTKLYELIESQIKGMQEAGAALSDKLQGPIDVIAAALPSNPDDLSPLKAPAADIIPDLPSVVSTVVKLFWDNDPIKRAAGSIETAVFQNWQDVARRVLSAKEYDSGLRVQPRDYLAATPSELVEAYLRGTPLERILTAETYVPLPPETRFRHQWVVGDTGAGKTTFISALIADDFKRVARNEASVFVMDSQNELIPDIAKLKVFAPGRPLHGKLVYLEPDPDYPLALNIFDVHKERMAQLSTRDRVMLESGAMWMVEFFLSSLVKAEASPHQDIFLNYTIPALMAIPNATIFTFKDLLEPAKVKGGPTGYDRYKQYFTNLRPDTQQWLAERMHSPEVAVTRNAIRARLDGFTSRGFFHDMFSHPRNKLDLFKELQSSKVILVNTMKGLLKSGTEPFGRYFIARLVQAMEERMFLDRGVRLPVFTYIDEASDYIAEEENVEELIDRARKQKMGFVFANQRESQITSSRVRDALSRVAIQARGEARGEGKPPLWSVAIDRREPVQVTVPNVRFQDLPKMTEAQHQALLQEMRERYAASPTRYPQEPAIRPDARVSGGEGSTEASHEY